MVCRSKYHVETLLKLINWKLTLGGFIMNKRTRILPVMYESYRRVLNRLYTLNSSLDLYLLFEKFRRALLP